MASQWGRKETVIWPPQIPIYTYGVLLLTIPITLTLLFGLYMTKPFLARNYTGAYIKAAAGSQFHRHGSYRLIYLGGGKRAPRVAQPTDFVPGTTDMPGGKKISIALSPAATAQGFTTFFRGPERKFADEPIHAWLQSDIFGGDDLLSSYGAALVEAGIIVIFMLCFAVPWDFKRGKRLKYGRLLRGPEMHTPREFNSILKGEGMGIRTNEKGTIVRLPSRSEPKHIQVMGDTGVGKTTLLIQMLSQIEDRGDSAIIYDPAGEFIQRFYREERGDVVLNPLDARSPYWTPSSELKSPAEARTIATSLYQPTSDKKGEFFTETPQKVFAHLLKYRPTPQDLVAWMSDESEIDRRVEGTELAAMIAKEAPDQRNGVLGSLGLIADALRLLPTREQGREREWSATEWADKREGWIFLTSTEEAEQEALRPLHSLWIDLLILRLLAPAKAGQKRAWFVIDELATLQRLPQFHTALTKGRKSNNPIIFGYQGKSQLEVIYGHLAEVMLSQPATRIIMKTGEPKAAKWASELIGEIEIERVRETVADGKRAGKSFMMDRQIEPLVMGSEIEGLADLHAFLKLGNHVTRFSFPHMDRPLIAPGLIPRGIPEHDMWLNPLAPPSTVPAATQQPVMVAASSVVKATPSPVQQPPVPLSPPANASPRPVTGSLFGSNHLTPATDPSTDL
jgi:type IV secretory pathway TraG/TraD family ATPase VirD4